MFVWVASYPRSGSNLTMLTLRQAFGFRKGLVAHPTRTLEKFGLPADTDLLPALEGVEETVALKTHRRAAPNDPAPAIYLVRDGRDAVVSYAHFVKGRGQPGFADLSFDATLKKIITESMRNGTWSENVRSWTLRSAPTIVVRFESLIRDPISVLSEAVESLGIAPESLKRKTIPTFEELQERDPVMYRKGKVGTWKGELSPDMEELFWELHGSEMQAQEYQREKVHSAANR